MMEGTSLKRYLGTILKARVISPYNRVDATCWSLQLALQALKQFILLEQEEVIPKTRTYHFHHGHTLKVKSKSFPV